MHCLLSVKWLRLAGLSRLGRRKERQACRRPRASCKTQSAKTMLIVDSSYEVRKQRSMWEWESLMCRSQDYRSTQLFQLRMRILPLKYILFICSVPSLSGQMQAPWLQLGAVRRDQLRTSEFAAKAPTNNAKPGMEASAASAWRSER